MGKLNEIREKLSAGSTAKQLVEQGYAKSSVFSMAKKLKGSQPNIPAMPVSDELQELRRQRDMIKLQEEIAELEASKERLPERVAALESSSEGLPTRILFLEKQLDRTLDAIEGLFFELVGITMSVRLDEYGALVRHKRTEQDRDLSEKKAGEFIAKYRLEKGQQEPGDISGSISIN